MTGDKKYLYLTFIGTGLILATVLLMKIDILSTELSGIFLGVYIGWMGATWLLRYLTLREEANSLKGKSKKILDELKNTIVKK